MFVGSAIIGSTYQKKLASLSDRLIILATRTALLSLLGIFVDKT